MNTVFKECIKKLEAYSVRYPALNGDSESIRGANLARFCITDGVISKIQEIQELYADEFIKENSVAALLCIELTDQLVNVLKKTAEEKDNAAFGRAYKSHVKQFIVDFQPLCEWLKKLSVNTAYDN